MKKFQTYTQENTKIVAASAISSENAAIEDKAKKRLVVEKVNNVMGSTAGAGSGEFDMYRAARRRETIRMDVIVAEKKAADEAREYAEKMKKNKEDADSRTAKNADRRKKKKMKKLELKRKYTEEERSEQAEQKDRRNNGSTTEGNDIEDMVPLTSVTA